MSSDDKKKPIENELWDDKNEETRPSFHIGCDGKVVWISGDEWRCFKCAQRVEPEDMKMEIEA